VKTQERAANELIAELASLGLDLNTQPSLQQWRTFLGRITPRFAQQAVTRELHHSVRTPLTVVLGASELLLESELDSEQRQVVHNLHKSGREVLDVLDRMLSTDSVAQRSKSWPPRITTPVAMPRLELPKVQHRLLLAEDNEFNRVLIERALSPLNCDVEFADNGHEVLQKFAPGKYALVLMDCEMPEMNGISATREIRSREQDGTHVPIIAVTASAGSDASRLCFDAGMDDFLAKPFSVASLRRKVMHWLFVGNQAAEHATLTLSGVRSRPARGKRSSSNDVLDMSRLDELSREAGSLKIVEDLSNIFVEDLARRIELIREAVRTRDERAFGALAHSIKGACSNFGAMRMAGLGEELERRSRVNDFKDALQNVQKLSEEFELVRRVLETEVFAPRAAAQVG
jgi:CheY-like chemotaxis protein/HPt (histidine-containing phosphotransfer) domain-containing protein